MRGDSKVCMHVCGCVCVCLCVRAGVCVYCPKNLIMICLILSIYLKFVASKYNCGIYIH